MSGLDETALDELATAWVNEIVPSMYEAMDRAGIEYNDEMICHLLSDGFKAGYATCLEAK